MLWHSVLFAGIYLYICNWHRVRIFIKAILKPKEYFSDFTDKKFLERINKKLGVKEFIIKVQKFEQINGYMMLGSKRTMVITSVARENLTNDELNGYFT